MAAKRFGAALLASQANTKITTGKPGYDSTVNVTFCNQTGGPALLYLAYCNDPQGDCNVEDSEYLLFSYPLPSHHSHDVRGIAVQAMHCLVARSSIGGVSVVAYGYEEEAR